MMRYIKSFYKEEKIAEEKSKYKVLCKCGTKTIIVNTDKAICRGCGHWVYKNKQIEFKEKMREALNKNERK